MVHINIPYTKHGTRLNRGTEMESLLKYRGKIWMESLLKYRGKIWVESLLKYRGKILM